MYGLIAVIISYFIGGFLTAGIIASIRRVDLRIKGSGNFWATNDLRDFGPFVATLVLLGDIAKGVLGVWVGLRLGGSKEVAALCGLAVIIGHNWPLFFGFQGGKGIATTLGAIILLVPKTAMVVLPCGYWWSCSPVMSPWPRYWQPWLCRWPLTSSTPARN